MSLAGAPVVETQSYTLALRDGCLAAALRQPAFSGFKLRKTRQLPIQTADIPTLGASIVDESLGPEGDGNAGELRFMTTARIGFSAVIVNNDQEASETTLDRLYMALLNGVLRDPYLTGFIDTYSPELGEETDLNARFESVPRITRRMNFGVMGQKNETPIAELQCEMTLFYRQDFPPTIQSDLDVVEVQSAVGYPNQDQVQQVRMPIWFAQPKEKRR
jgi:hypothetical protein